MVLGTRTAAQSRVHPHSVSRQGEEEQWFQTQS